MNRIAIAALQQGVPASIAGRAVELRGPREALLRDASGAIVVRVPPATRAPVVGSLLQLDGALGGDGVFGVDRVRFHSVPSLRPGAGGSAPEWAQPGWIAKGRELAARDVLLRALRGWFHAEGFLEVETPALLPAPGQEPHLRPFATTFHGRADVPLWLATSPEYAMKRLLAIGCERIVQLGRAWRDGRDEHSPLHAPEFTLLEWYRAWDSLGRIGHDVETLLRTAAAALLGRTIVERGGAACDLAQPPIWVSVEQAFRELAGVELEPYLAGDDAAFLASLPQSAAPRPRAGPHAMPASSDRERADSAYFRLLIERIEPKLGVGRPTFLCRYPARHAALAELCADDPLVAERFEVYVLGIELGNAFQELRDPIEQERRLTHEQKQRVDAGGPLLPISEEFLAALASGLPPCAGIALGVDRLHLLLTGAAKVADVQPFPFEPPVG